MTLNQLIALIGVAGSLGVFSWLVYILSPLIDQAFAKLEAQAKNTNLLSAEKWAQQTVHEIEFSLAGYKGTVKKDAAVSLLTQRIMQNNLAGHFSAEAVSSLIEWAVGQMNGQVNHAAVSTQTPVFGHAPAQVDSLSDSASSVSEVQSVASNAVISDTLTYTAVPNGIIGGM